MAYHLHYAEYPPSGGELPAPIGVDAAAAGAGVPIGALYRTGNAVQVRLA